MLSANYIRKWLREESDAIRKAVAVKGVSVDVDRALELDEQLLKGQQELDSLNAERKQLQRKGADPEAREQGRRVGERIKEIKSSLATLDEEFAELAFSLPYPPSEHSPIGPDDSANVEIKRVGEQRPMVMEHSDFLARRGWVDFEGARRVAGARSYAVRDALVILEQAVHQMVLRSAMREGFTPVFVPTLALESAFVGTGWFPAGQDEVYRLEGTDLFLSGTAEVPLLGLHEGEVLAEDDLPILYAGISPCYRKEAGSAGRDTRGLIRVHEFRKTELFVYCKNDVDESAAWHARLLAISEQLLVDLDLPYRIVETSTGDMGMGKFRMNDIEVWFPSQGRYREANSCSTLHDWQARRAGIRYKADRGTQFVHTLNNTAVATPRLLAALVENHLTDDGQLQLPAALRDQVEGSFGDLGLALFDES